MTKVTLKIHTNLKVTLISMLLLATNLVFAENKLSVTLEQAAEKVRKSENGRVLSAKTTYFNGQLSHRIKVLTSSGRVKIVEVPTTRLKSDRKIDESLKKDDSPNMKPSRYQKLNQQKPKPVESKPNYRRPDSARTNTDKSRK